MEYVVSSMKMPRTRDWAISVLTTCMQALDLIGHKKVFFFFLNCGSLRTTKNFDGQPEFTTLFIFLIQTLDIAYTSLFYKNSKEGFPLTIA